MFDKLDFILEKYEELSKKVSDPDVIAKQKEWQKLMKEMSDLEPIVKEYTAYKKAKEELEEAKEILDNGGLTKSCVRWRVRSSRLTKQRLRSTQRTSRFCLLPKGP